MVTKATKAPVRRRRPLKYLVQVVFVDEVDGELREMATQPVTVAAAEWSDFIAAGGQMEQGIAQAVEQFETASTAGA